MDYIKVKNIAKKFNSRQNQLRLFIMDRMVTWGRPFNLKDDMPEALSALSMDGAEYRDCVAVLEERDGLVTDGEDSVNFIYPVSGLETKHRVTLADGRTFCAMCAIDAIGAAFTFRQNTEIHSACAVCGAPITVRVQDGRLAEYDPPTLHAISFKLQELKNWAGSC